jgi:hypothetical protein
MWIYDPNNGYWYYVPDGYVPDPEDLPPSWP